MRTHIGWLWIGLAGCESAVTRVGPGLDPNLTGLDDTATDTGENTTVDGFIACDNRTIDGSCLGYSGDEWDQTTAEATCDGQVFDGRCPESELGACRRDIGFPLEYVQYYYVGGFYDADADTFLQSDCELNGGVWIL